MIDGVVVTPLRQICDERGKVMKMLSRDDAVFSEFGEVYFSVCYPGAIKGWHIHKRMTLNYAVPVGHIKFVLYDERQNSPTRGQVQEFFLGPDNYCLVTVPPMIWNGFKCISNEAAFVVNCATIGHDPQESDKRDPFDKSIPYDWALKHG
jgi:dTDP-4-dehydrorhamnose 3,5-epimerase